jgi:anaerobic ribonucleoside-triphosphate reductase activating protein
MVKYTNTQVVFQEVPNKISLAINISNCQNNCRGCHSPYLKKDIGTELTIDELDKLIDTNDGINCVVFMGEGNDQGCLISLAKHVRERYNNTISTALYSGREEVEWELYEYFDYIKVGPYIPEMGPINKTTTNQRFYTRQKFGNVYERVDLTSLFWK